MPSSALSPLALLRRAMIRHGVDAYLVPRADEHQGEYVPPSAMRLQWLTGFSGSAGIAVAMAQRAALFVDGRYTLQAAAEVDPDAFELVHLVDHPPHDWLAENLPKGAKLGYDPWLHTPAGVNRLAEACRKAGAEPVPLAVNLVDQEWTNRPAPPSAPIVAYPLAYSGRGADEKRAEIGRALSTKGQNAVFLSAPDSIAWLLNIRGGDVPFAPLPLCFAIVHANGTVDLFADEAKISQELPAHLGPDVRILPPSELGPALDELGGGMVRLDSQSAPAWVADRLTGAGARIAFDGDPCTLPKACKTEAEMVGARAAHRRDGVALTRFLAWLSKTAPKGGIDEIAAAQKIDSLRGEEALFQEPSFPTISGAGSNGAIVHYRVSPDTNRHLLPGELYLVDSGGQYLDGTTDVTRTVAVGVPGPEERHRFTLVLKGHVALAKAHFPKGTTGSALDALARAALWAEGLDYDHGTGHGVGSYLSVHEGPHRISKLANNQALLPGMIVSNEPGYYKTGAYGIRIENLLAVGKTDPKGDWLGFETLTLAPIDRALIETNILTADERAWIDAYHARVRTEIGPMLDAETSAWLDEATAPLS